MLRRSTKESNWKGPNPNPINCIYMWTLFFLRHTCGIWLSVVWYLYKPKIKVY